MPGDLNAKELIFLHQESKKLKGKVIFEKEEKAEDLCDRRRSSFSIASEDFDTRVLKAMITNEAFENNVVTKSAAYFSFGSILTLLEARSWAHNQIVLLGVTPLSCELYHLLTRETATVFLSDPISSKIEETNIAPRAFLSWDKVQAVENNWDIIVFCSRACPILDEKIIQSYRCKAIIAISDDFLPIDQERRKLSLMQLEKNNISEVAEGICDLGGFAKAFSLSNNSFLSFNDAFKMGCKAMRKKLHLHGIITSDDVTAKRKFHDLMLTVLEKDEKARLFGLGTVMHHSSDVMTAWLGPVPELCVQLSELYLLRMKQVTMLSNT